MREVPGDLRVKVLRKGPRELVVLSFTPRGGGSMSAAELRVAAAMARGHSNAAIAHSHGVSTRTVANQVAAVLRKLGVSNRAEVAAIFGIEHLR
jgi:DNA-binding NarL/FixJ family response regulator